MICSECGIHHGDLYVQDVGGRVVPVQSDASARLLGYEQANIAVVHNGRCQAHLPEPTYLRLTR